jgi:hypothetical protein
MVMEKVGTAKYIQYPRTKEELGETPIFGGTQVFFNNGEVRI